MDKLCGARTRSGHPCKNIPFLNGKCKFHGGSSTGPSDVSKLYGNKNATGNKGGGAPKGNKNAAKKHPIIDERTIGSGPFKIRIRHYRDKEGNILHTESESLR